VAEDHRTLQQLEKLSETVQTIATSQAVLIASMQQVRDQLARQNGSLRTDHETLVRQGTMIESLCKDRDEDRRLLKEHTDQLRSVEITIAQRMITGGAGGAIVAVLWAVANWLTTGNPIP